MDLSARSGQGARDVVLVESNQHGHTKKVENGRTSYRRSAHDIKAGGDEEKRNNHLKAKKVKSDESMALQDGEMINEGDDSPSLIPGLRALRGENDSRNWNHGTYKVPAKRRESMEICAPSATRDGDTLFAFLR
ncbi:hypothetical protein ACHAXA_005648 [Cyclostephanos tholiformis]|uniref:Uncharacterized protein n=1 Tax=Cyclostephanos tholiformis TaxID=382380 RepID=A0ABD3RJ23_9STRA